MDNNAIVIKDLVKKFGSLVALNKTNLRLKTGELLAVLGPSGCGKTTLLRTIAGFDHPDSGSIIVDGQDITALKPAKRHIGIVPQEGALFPHLNVAKNIVYGINRDRNKNQRLDELLELVGLTKLSQRMPHELSGGQRQRVALARALAPGPSLLLLDEPFSALDATLRQQVRSFVADVVRKAGATALLVTHDQDEALSMADRVALMHEGTIIQCDTPENIYHRPVNRWAADFVGDAVMWEGTIHTNAADRNGDILVDTPMGVIPAIVSPTSATTELRTTPPPSLKPLATSDTVTVMVRPEQFALKPVHTGQGQGSDNTASQPQTTNETIPIPVEATVQAIEYFGHDCLLTIDTATNDIAGIQCQVRMLGSQFHVGDKVLVHVTGKAIAYADGI